MRKLLALYDCILDDAGKYGRIIRDESNRVRESSNTKTPARLKNRSRNSIRESTALIHSSFFGALKETNNTNQQGEYYLTDALSVLYNQGKVVSSVIFR